MTMPKKSVKQRINKKQVDARFTSGKGVPVDTSKIEMVDTIKKPNKK